MILHYFSPSSDSILFGTENCCDNCALSCEPECEMFLGDSLDDPSQKSQLSCEHDFQDFGPDAKLLMKAVEFFRGKFGISKVTKFLRGSKAQDIPHWAQANALHGLGKDRKGCLKLIETR